MQSTTNGEKLNKKIPNVSSTSSLSPSTSGNHQNSNTAKLQNLKNISTKTETLRATSKTPLDVKNHSTTSDGRKKVPPPFKKAHSQAHIQVKAIQAAQFAVENETRKIKKSRSFDRHSPLEIHRHTSGDNKKVKTKI